MFRVRVEFWSVARLTPSGRITCAPSEVPLDTTAGSTINIKAKATDGAW